MSRLKHYARSLASSYALMGVNVVYTLVSIPLALLYLDKAEFGLWAITLQVSTYIGLLDLGMGSSVSRILIDHKDHRSNGRYGSAVQSGFLVGFAQGLIALIVGLATVWFLGDWLNVGEKAATAAEKAELQHYFFWLMLGQVLITAGTFATRMLTQILYAWQRMDLANYSAMSQLLVGLGALWLGFHLNLGVYSLLLGAALSWMVGLLLNLALCYRFGLLPKKGEWGRPNRAQFNELFSYGADVFLISLGTQLIMSSQVVLISRQLGEDAVALWSVMTKVFTLLSQVVWRIIGNAMPAFAEMQVRNEREHLWNRYRQLFVTVSVVSAVCATIFAVCNGPFVHVWTRGQFSWPFANDLLLAGWLIVAAQQCSHNSLIMCLKKIGALKYVCLLEGMLFVLAAALIMRTNGITGMLACSLIGTLLFTWAMGTWRTAQLLGNPRELLLDWQIPLLKTLAMMIPAAAILHYSLQSTSELVQLTANLLILSFVATLVLIWTIPREALTRLLTKLPSEYRRFVPGILIPKR